MRFPGARKSRDPIPHLPNERLGPRAGLGAGEPVLLRAALLLSAKAVGTPRGGAEGGKCCWPRGELGSALPGQGQGQAEPVPAAQLGAEGLSARVRTGGRSGQGLSGALGRSGDSGHRPWPTSDLEGRGKPSERAPCLVALDVSVLALGWRRVPRDLQLAGREWVHLHVLWSHGRGCGESSGVR